MTRLQIRTDDNALAGSIFVQHQNFNQITQVTVIKLIVTNAMGWDRRILRHHEIERGARGPGVRRAQSVVC